MDTKDEKFGARLKRLLAERGITQAEFARKTGIERTELNRTINDKRQPKPDEITWIAQALEMSTEALLDGAELPKPVERARAELEELTGRILRAEAERDAAQARADSVEKQAETERHNQEAALRKLEAHAQELTARHEREMNDLHAQSAAREAQLTKALQETRVHLTRASSIAQSCAAEKQVLADHLRECQRQLSKARSDKVATGVLTGLAGVLLGGSLGGGGGRFRDDDFED